MDFRQRLEQSRIHSPGNNNATEAEENPATMYFATDRGSNPVCVDLRFEDGSRKAIPYAYFLQVSYDAELGIEIQTNQKHISITGRNLMTLYESLVTYRVRYIQADMGADTQEDGLFVAKILIEDTI